MNRRTLLAGSAAFAASSPALAANNPDAALLAHCAEYHRLMAVIKQWDASIIAEEEGEAAQDDWWQHFDAIVDLRPRTMPGLRAKAAALAVAIPHLAGDTESQEPEEVLAMSLARDVAGFVG